MWQQLAASFAAGVSVGPACLIHCGLFHAAFLARHAPADRRRSAFLGVALLIGRLAAYLLFGAAIGLIASTGVVVLSPWALTLILGLLMLAYAVLPRRERPACACKGRDTRLVGGALLLGFVTGLSPCPPFLASGLIALQSRGVGMAVLTLLVFFAGSSLYLIPLWFGLAAISANMRRRLGLVSRFIAAGVALYAFALLARGDSAGGGSLAPGPGPEARAAAPAVRTEDKEPASAEAAAPAEAPPVKLPPPAGEDIEPLFPKEVPTRRFTEKLLRRLQLSVREAMYYTPLGEGTVRCDLCPTGCILEDGQQGMCRARANVGGKLRSITYGRPVSINVDPIEKKPLFHVIPSTDALSLATVGCNLGCVFCQNFEISQAAPEDLRHQNVPPRQLVELALKHDCDGIAYTYTEPTVFFEYMLDTSRLAREKGLKNYWITCGQIEEAPLLDLCKVLDAANVDLKGFSDEFYVKYCNAHLYPVLRTLKILRREKVFFEITNLIIPGANDDDQMIRDMCRWIVRSLGADTPVHFSRFHPAYKLTRRPATPIATLRNAREIALQEGLQFVYIGNVRAPGVEDTVCSMCDKTVIKRTGYHVVSNRIKAGRCEFCGAPIPGIWK